MDLDLWGRLSNSSRAAMQWALALARLRAEQSGRDPQSAVIDPFDLWVSFLLAHPNDSEAQALLRHFQLSPGQLLPDDYPQPPADALARQLSQLPSEPSLPLDDDARELVTRGIELGLKSGNEKVAELRAIFAGWLMSSHAATQRLNELLTQRGSRLSSIVSTMEDHLLTEAGPLAFAKLLMEKHRFRATPVDLPNYKADHGQKNSLAADLVEIQAEVDAFAYLLASCGLRPPLAVGLFGDWGSGKSFFMDAVRDRISALTASVQDEPQSNVPFWKRVVQIEFNAWHYVEGELWASLVDHIFSQLKLANNEEETLVNQRRDFWLEKLGSTRVKLAQLESQREEAKRHLHDTREAADTLRRRRDSELARIEQLKSRQVTQFVLRDATLQSVETALKGAGFSLTVSTSEEAQQKLAAARARLSRGGALLRELTTRPTHLLMLAAAIVVPPLVVALVRQLDRDRVDTTLAAWTGFSVTCGTVLAAAARAASWISKQLAGIDEAETSVRDQMQAVRAAWSKSIEEAEKAANDAESQFRETLQREEKVTNQLETIHQELELISPERLLHEFVSDRVGSGDYRQRLGIPALIQNDFRHLARLIAEQNESQLTQATTDSTDANSFNRIILYIDDLDRCPEEHVIEVLQAVHLLLAFELFVVVVAVDSRWLSHALRQHYPALVSGGESPDHATPDDYLEKIFQVPFWIEPLPETARQRMVHGLLRDHLVAPKSPGDQQVNGNVPKIEDIHRQVLKSLNPSAALPTLDAAALTITPEELEFLDKLAPLLGRTPRSVKRFVNLYQLVRTIHRAHSSAAQQTTPDDDQVLAFLLAIFDGMPTIASALAAQLQSAGVETTLGTAIAALTRVPAESVTPLTSWLDDRRKEGASWNDVSSDRLRDLIALVDRFRFRIR